MAIGDNLPDILFVPGMCHQVDHVPDHLPPQFHYLFCGFAVREFHPGIIVHANIVPAHDFFEALHLVICQTHGDIALDLTVALVALFLEIFIAQGQRILQQCIKTGIGVLELIRRTPFEYGPVGALFRGPGRPVRIEASFSAHFFRSLQISPELTDFSLDLHRSLALERFGTALG
jgi:hypothetical protein